MMRAPFNNLYVFRHKSVSDESQPACQEEALALSGKTVYRAFPRLEDAPGVMDCLTSVHYLFKNILHIQIDLTWIGDMPRELFKRKDWEALSIDRKGAKFGDIVFTKHVNRPKLLSHVGMIFGSDTIFHCSLELKTVQVVSDAEFFQSYVQQLSLDKALRYIDPRNKSLRELYPKGFIPKSKLQI